MRILIALFTVMLFTASVILIFSISPPNFLSIITTPLSGQGLFWDSGPEFVTTSDNTTIGALNNLIDQNPKDVWSYESKWYPTRNQGETNSSSSTRLTDYIINFPDSSLASSGQSDVASYIAYSNSAYNSGHPNTINIAAIKGGYGAELPASGGAVGPTYWYSFQFKNIIFQMYTNEGSAGSISIPRSVFIASVVNQYKYVAANIGLLGYSHFRTDLFVLLIIASVLAILVFIGLIWRWSQRRHLPYGNPTISSPPYPGGSNSPYKDLNYYPDLAIREQGNYPVWQTNPDNPVNSGIPLYQSNKIGTIDPPPTRTEMQEALLNPWPGHSPIETIERNRKNNASEFG
ncbi:MAG: hypothetical protein HKL80_01940 [Acidimicrobiales bacterium]|nr:hypothetical protein [Acidimicrobiales bacterium]